MAVLTMPEHSGALGSQGGRGVSVVQQKGGSGKTTVAVHLAVAWAEKYSVAVLDVDPQGSLGEWFEAREERLGERLEFGNRLLSSPIQQVEIFRFEEEQIH